MDLTVLFIYLKIILLQYFQFSIFSFSNNKLNPNEPYEFEMRLAESETIRGGVWFVFSTNYFQFLNNISRISIHFFIHTYFYKYF